VGNIVVKLEGEARTALQVPSDYPERLGGPSPGDYITESHKLLYMIQQVYPGQASGVTRTVGAQPGVLAPGQHEFRFQFKIPLNNICSDPKAMSSLTGVGASSGGSLFGGFRTMDGTKQLMLQHVKQTLPPSLTGFPQKAEILYYIKVTIQRPGILKENWRYDIGFKFLPVEPPRPPPTGNEAYARRPFIFEPRSAVNEKKKFSFMIGKQSQPQTQGEKPTQFPPAFEVSARLPHPSILTCNQTVPLRIIAKKVKESPEQVYLTSLDVMLVGFTDVKCHQLRNREVNTWILCTASALSIPLGSPSDPLNTEVEIPNNLWADRRLPNTIAPSFTACNILRRYEIEIKIGLSWGLPSKNPPFPQSLFLPLKLSNVEVFSGITPPAALVKSASTSRPRPQQQQQQQPSTSSQAQTNGPPLPPRRPTGQHNPLYPPQLGPGNQPVPNYDDAPPSYDEAVAQDLTGPAERPAYSGVTEENAHSTIPEKSGWH
jgi:hypothetical protein